MVDGKLIKKAQLVARGFQQEGVEDLFYPAARMVTVRTLFLIALNRDFKFVYLDVKSALLNGDLNDKVFMYIPNGVDVSDIGKICKLNMALYG